MRRSTIVLALCVLGLAVPTTALAEKAPRESFGEPTITVTEKPIRPGGMPMPPSDGGGGYPFCVQVVVEYTQNYLWGWGHYRVTQDVGYCGDGGWYVTDVLWARTRTHAYGVCGTNAGPWTWHLGGGSGQHSVDYQSAAEVVCSAYGWTFYGTQWISRRYVGDGYHYTLNSGGARGELDARCESRARSDRRPRALVHLGCHRGDRAAPGPAEIQITERPISP